MGRLPEWLRIRHVRNSNSEEVEALSARLSLHTVCQSAHCPNRSECWAARTATFMVMGEHCTRACRFCAVKTSAKPPPLDDGEPERLAEAAAALGLGYAVITSVTRDDLPDQGADHIARCIRAVRARSPDILIEALVPDFRADENAIETVLGAMPDVYSHNIETVERLSPAVRDRRAGYRQSLRALALARELSRGSAIIKSGLMVGLGEEDSEVLQAMSDLRDAGVEILTVGQYLSPSKSGRHLPVARFVEPDGFRAYEGEAYRRGFRFVASGPLVRSSYRAAEPFLEGVLSRPRRR